MLIGNLPEDTSISNDGYVIYSEDGTHLSKMKVKNINGGGAGLKYWKETENSLYRVQHNEGQWLFDDHFKVPGAAEMIVGAVYWDFSVDGPDRALSDPIMEGHVDPDTGETYYTEEDGPEIAFLNGRIKYYYIFRRISNKVVMGGTLWYKFWGEASESRLPDEEYGGTSRYRYNLPGWLLMSTDKDTLTYQLVKVDPWSYDQMGQTIQERIDNGFFRYEHMADQTISTIAPLDTPITHTATGAAFYINGMPDPEIYEPLIINANTQGSQGVYYFHNFKPTYAYTPPSGLDPIVYPYGNTLNLYSPYYDHLDSPDPSKTSWPVQSSEDGWYNWVLKYCEDPIGSNHMDYERLSSVRVAAYDLKLQDRFSPHDVGFPENIKGPYLAYFGAVYNHSGYSYSNNPGKTAVEYPFHDGNILYPQGYFTGVSTGFDADAKGKVFYSGPTNDEYDTPQVDLANFFVDIGGNIYGNNIDATGSIKSNNYPVPERVIPLVSQGTKIAIIYLSGEDTPIELYAPEGGGGGGGGSYQKDNLWTNSYLNSNDELTNTTSVVQISENITLNADFTDYDELEFEYGIFYGTTQKRISTFRVPVDHLLAYKTYYHVTYTGSPTGSSAIGTKSNLAVMYSMLQANNSVYYTDAGASYLRHVYGIKY